MKLRKKATGHFVNRATAGEAFKAFVPNPLPPDPPLDLKVEHFDRLERANRALGKLDGLSRFLPDVSLFVYWYVRKEAVLSSQIEGTQSSLSDLLLYEQSEAPGVPVEDVQEVSHYVAAVRHGIDRLREGFPLSLRLLREVHEVLLKTGRGSTKQPGEFRRSQNWIGGTRPGNARFIPPPPESLIECLGDLEKFLHDTQVRTPALIKAGLSHVQFETIHPFLDGNGRIGRLLITLLLVSEGAISEPTLYLSLYFKRHREIYYELLQKVRTEGAWEEWLQFFLEGVEFTADEAVKTALGILNIFEEDRSKIESLGRSSGNILRVHSLLQRKPIISIPVAAEDLQLTPPTVRSAISTLEEMGMVQETTGKLRDRLFVYKRYMDLLQEDIEER
ncbi:MAG TPA: Fic family protein [Pyrinomonadaceae bacterium]|nr:Fic family protein [Pyrinomonadaceae bacterium]HMP64785.1 Fic family protein [Pyrinomonadaceae bacterium]